MDLNERVTTDPLVISRILWFNSGGICEFFMVDQKDGENSWVIDKKIIKMKLGSMLVLNMKMNKKKNYCVICKINLIRNIILINWEKKRIKEEGKERRREVKREIKKRRRNWGEK